MTMSQSHRRSFASVLVNTFIATLTTNFLWFALTFWIYLESRSVLATSLLGGSYLLLMAVCGVPFGMLVDRHPKKHVMVGAQIVTVVSFAAALAFFVWTPTSEIARVGSPAFWVFGALILVGALVASARGIALSTTVTLLVPEPERARANGVVGIVGGLSFAVTSVFSGLSVGLLGMGWSLVIALALSVAALAHLAWVSIPEHGVVHAEGVPQPVDFAAAFRAVRAVPGLWALIAFSTLNNLLGGVFMALMDPYGLTLVSVEVWGVLWGVLSFGFLAGGAWVAKFGLGERPLRSLLLANVVMWLIGLVFTLRESIWLLAAGILVYMALIPIVEAAERTVLQRVVPFETQGRVFGLAQAVEVAAAPVSAFLIGPLAEFGLIPYLRTPAGASTWGWLLGAGEARGIALVFVLTGVAGLVLTAVALASAPYRRLSAAYAAAPRGPTGEQGEGPLDV